MKYQIKSAFLTILLLIAFQLSSFAQERFSVTPSLGLVSPILSNGLGLQVAVNPAFKVYKRLHVEGQVSYIQAKIDNYFLSSDGGSVKSLGALVGPRFYFTKEEKKNKFYVNLLLGSDYNWLERDNRPKEEGFDLGASVGAYMVFTRYLVGLSLESPAGFTIRAGIVF